MRGDTMAPPACPACGWDADKEAVVCPVCRADIPHESAQKKDSDTAKAEECEHWSELPTHSVRTAKVGVGGILVLLAGFLGMTHALLSVLPGTGDDILATYGSVIAPGEALNDILDSYEIFAGLMLLFGVLAVALSTFTFNRSNFDGALASGVFGVLSIGFLFGAFFALIGLLLIATSRREFIPECR
ncbi:MAG: hypothetical protein A3K60_07800 [Euryarchaeota archaeon RBG_19FT_COMBO_56_21]|nr:MAG: hypothetical protein A3K60_07800 [Euryarchaeota archaeon RBG_19FT_COMBO_56_21]